MPLRAFDHVNIRTGQLDDMVDWYDKILGLKAGPRPDFPFGGAWLYLGDNAVIHLVDADPAPQPHRAEENLRLEHFSFRGADYPAFIAKLEQYDVAYRVSPLEDMGTVAVNLWDPDGNHIHVDFPIEES